MNEKFWKSETFGAKKHIVSKSVIQIQQGHLLNSAKTKTEISLDIIVKNSP